MIRRLDPINKIHEGMEEKQFWDVVNKSVEWYYGGVLRCFNQSLGNFKVSAGGESYVHAALKLATSAHLYHMIDEPIKIEYEWQCDHKSLDVAYWVPSEGKWSGAECETMVAYQKDPQKVVKTAMKGDLGLGTRFLVLDLSLYEHLWKNGLISDMKFSNQGVEMPCMFHLPEIIEAAREVILASAGHYRLESGANLSQLSHAEMNVAIRKGFDKARTKMYFAS